MLYLPGLIETWDTLDESDTQNLPASTFYRQILGTAYTVRASSGDSGLADYSGSNNMALVS